MALVAGGLRHRAAVRALAPQALLHDESFTPPAQPIDAREVFAVDDAMRDYLRHNTRGALYFQNRADWLVQSLYKRGELKLEYDAAVTRNAAQAFDARAGNCLSLVVMTAALAKELGLQVEYNSAYTEETWSRNGSLLLRSGHINITIGRRMRRSPARRWMRNRGRSTSCRRASCRACARGRSTKPPWWRCS